VLKPENKVSQHKDPDFEGLIDALQKQLTNEIISAPSKAKTRLDSREIRPVSKFSDTRFAIAFSGGGDSTALLYAMRDYAHQSLALIVDHGLRAGSKEEANAAKTFAESLGYDTRVLTWATQGLSIETGLQEKARCARYRLLGEECRQAGIKYLITGHTKDDQAETLFMRYGRNTDWRGARGMSVARYAPLWPELAEVTVLRPLLNISREQLRDYNGAHGLKWVEDVSNSNLAFSRIQAREYLSEHPRMQDILLEPVADLNKGQATERGFLRNWAEDKMHVDALGYITLKSVPPVELLFQCIRAVSGTGGPIDRTKLRTVIAQMQARDFKAVTLAGSKVEAHMLGYLISRDMVAVKGRRGIPPVLTMTALDLRPKIWDGRYQVQSTQAGWSVKPAYKLTPHLPKTLQADLLSVPASARPTLPVLFDPDGTAHAIGPYESNGVRICALFHKRLFAQLQ